MHQIAHTSHAYLPFTVGHANLTHQSRRRVYTSRQCHCSTIPIAGGVVVKPILADRRCPYPAISHLDNNHGQCRPSLCSRLRFVARYSSAYCRGCFVIGRFAPIYQYRAVRAWQESVPKRHTTRRASIGILGAIESVMGFRHLAEWHAVPCGEV